MLIASGYIYDIFGRRWTIFWATFLGGLSLNIIPRGAPNEWMFIAGTSLFNLLICPLQASPLIIDYVAKESIGTAISFGMIGLSLGVICTLLVVFEFTKDLDPLYSWGVMSALLIISAFVNLAMI